MNALNRLAMSPGVGLMLVAAGMSVSVAAAAAGSTCSARSTASAPTVVELYTSEGCSSCPPADRWLSRLNADPNVVALAFHVDYWDRLGWKDRFASPAFTQRQAEQQRTSGARFSYTPQVIVDGVDRPDWPRASIGSQGRPSAPVAVTIARDGRRFDAVVTPAAAAPMRLAAYWAVTEQGHVSAIRAGENEGATLRHDDVVREYRPVAAWDARTGAPVDLRFEPAGSADPTHPRQVSLVIVDAATGRPVQSVRLGC